MTSNAKRDAAALEHYYEFQKKDEETFKNGNVVIEARFGSFCTGYDYRDAEVAELRVQLKTRDEAIEEMKTFISSIPCFCDTALPDVKEKYPHMVCKPCKVLTKINTLLGREG